MISQMKARTRRFSERLPRRGVPVAALFGTLAVLVIHTSGAFAQQPAAATDPNAAGPQVGSAGPAEQAPPTPPGAYPQGPAPAQPGAYPAYPAYPPSGGQPSGYPPGYAPPPYGPPPSGYGQPPASGGYGYPPPPPSRYGYYPPPPPAMASRPITDRPFTIGGSLGLGGLRFHDDTNQSTSDLGVGYSVRLGFGIAPRLQFLLGIDGATSGHGDFVYDQTIYYGGLQAFLTRQLFLRGGVGFGNITQKDNGGGDFLFFGKTGFGLTGSLGVELIQGYNWSLELAGQVTAGFYSNSEHWTSTAVNVGFNFF